MAITRQAPRHRLGQEQRPGSIRLHLDDIEDVVAYLRNSGQSVEISSVDATFDDVDDLRQARRHDLESLTIAAEPARIQVELHAASARVVCYSEEASARHLADRVATTLSAHRSVIPLFFRKGVRIALLVLLGVVVAAVAQVAGSAGEQRRFSGGLVSILGVVVVRSLLGARNTGGARIVPHRRTEGRKVAREVWLVLGTAAVTAAIAAAVAWRLST